MHALPIYLYPHQMEALGLTEGFNRVAYYYDMGLGKTYIGSIKMVTLGATVNLIICQKSKIADWVEHYKQNHPEFAVYDLTKPKHMREFLEACARGDDHIVGIINYELAWRRSELSKLKDFTLLLDESSMIQNEKAKRSRFILNMEPANVILLSGTPTAGKYERLWSQVRLLGWDISKTDYMRSYVRTMWVDFGGFMHEIVIGYKNVSHLKQKLAEHGAIFKKTEEVITLPDQVEQTIKVEKSSDYKKFMKQRYLQLPDGRELIGDNSLTKMLHARQLCGPFSKNKLAALKDLIESTEDRLIIFYNFTEEFELIKSMTDRPISYINGKGRDMNAYETESNSITLIQYQAGSMGGNYQKANKVVYFTLPLSCEHWMQSMKRIHRIGQNKTCFYYYLITTGTVEEKIFKTLKTGKDYTNKLFEVDYGGGEDI